MEGIRATGANKLEEILYGVLPQVMPLLISYSLYRFESNVRSATVVGMVGAGGIGVTLWGSDSRFPVPANLRPDGAYHRHGQPAGFPLSTVA